MCLLPVFNNANIYFFKPGLPLVKKHLLYLSCSGYKLRGELLDGGLNTELFGLAIELNPNALQQQDISKLFPTFKV